MNQNALTSTKVKIPVLRNIADLTPGVITNIMDKWGKGKELSISSLSDVDDLIWGLKRRKLVVIGGRPGQGKSSLMAQIAWDLAKQKKKVVFFSLEMTEQVVIERLLSCETGLDNFLVNTGSLVNHMDEHNDKILDFYNAVNEATFAINTTARTFRDITSAMDKVEADVIVVDYCQLIRTAGDRRSALEEFVRQIREYAIKKDVCMILGSQVNRTAHDAGTVVRPPQVWQLKESGSLEESADLILLVHWPFGYSRNPEEVDPNAYEISVDKNRDGRCGTVRCNFYPKIFRFENKKKESENGTRHNSNVDPCGRDRQARDL